MHRASIGALLTTLVFCAHAQSDAVARTLNKTIVVTRQQTYTVPTPDAGMRVYTAPHDEQDRKAPVSRKHVPCRVGHFAPDCKYR